MNFTQRDASAGLEHGTDKYKKLRQDVLSLNRSVSVIIPFRGDTKGMSVSMASVVHQLPGKLREIIIVDCQEPIPDAYVGMSAEEEAECRLRRNLLKRYKRLGNVTVTPLHAESAENKDEARNTWLHGAEVARGDYLLFLNEGDVLSGDFLGGVVTTAARAGADMAVSNIVVRWPGGRKMQAYRDEEYRFRERGEFFENYLEGAADFWGWYFPGNKVIRRDLWERARRVIEDALESAGKQEFYGQDLIIASVLWGEARNAVHTSAHYVIFDWGKEDAFFKRVMVSPLDVVHDVKRGLDFLYDYLGKDDDAFFRISDEFVRRFWWRSEWTLKDSAREEVRQELERLFYVEDFEYPGDGICEDFEHEREGLFEGQEDYSSGKNIHIYVAMHERAYVPPENKYIVPIQAGAVLSEERFEGMLHDDEGDNISERNKRYCELTAQYWAYKNDTDADHYGLWHYRRYFAFSERAEEQCGVISCENLNAAVLKKYGADERCIAEYCENYDLILPEQREVRADDARKLSVYEFIAREFEKKDLDLFIKIITSKYPSFYDALMEILDGKTVPASHIFIMRRDLFAEYSAFLFDVLGEVERGVDFSLRKQKHLEIIHEFAKVLLAVFAYSLEKDGRYAVFTAKVIEAKSAKPLAKIEKQEIPEGLRHIAVCLACNNDYVKYTSVLLAAIRANSSPGVFYDIVILHRDITETTRRICKSVFKGVKNFSLRFCDVSQNFEAYGDIYISRHLTYETYYRFLILDIFEGYDKILYLDCDMIANADIAELFDADLTGKYIGAVRDADFIISCNMPSIDVLHNDTIKALKFTADEVYGYFNAGLILFNVEEIRKDFTTEKMFKAAMARQWSYHDQDTLNSLFKGNVHYFDYNWNLFWYTIDERSFLTGYEPAIVNEWVTNAVKEPKLIHFTGAVKPWHIKAFNLSNFTVNLYWEYARKSPYYEILVSKLAEFSSAPTGWFVFTCSSHQNHGVRFFEVYLLDIVWSSSYLYIDLMYLSNHSSTVVDTLRISVSRLPKDDGTSHLVLQDYCFEKNLDVFKNNIGIKFEQNQKLIVFAKNPCQYTGFAFSARFLESRDIEKPRIVVPTKNFIHETAELPNNIKYVTGGGVNPINGVQKAECVPPL